MIPSISPYACPKSEKRGEDHVQIKRYYHAFFHCPGHLEVSGLCGGRRCYMKGGQERSH